MDDNKIKYNGSKLPATFYIHRDYRQPIDDSSLYSTYASMQENLQDETNKYYVGQMISVNNDNTVQDDYTYNTGVYYVNSYVTEDSKLTYTVDRLMGCNDVKQYVTNNTQKLYVGSENTLTVDGVEYTLSIDNISGNTGSISLKKYIAPTISSFSFERTTFNGVWGDITVDNSTQYIEYNTTYQITITPSNIISYACSHGTSDICVLGITVNNTYIYGTNTNSMYKDSTTNKYCDKTTKIAYEYVSSDISHVNVNIPESSAAYIAAVTVGDRRSGSSYVCTAKVSFNATKQTAILYMHDLAKDNIISSTCSINNKITISPNYTFYAWNSTNTLGTDFDDFSFAKGNNLCTSLPKKFTIDSSEANEYKWLLVKKSFITATEGATVLTSETGTTENESTILKWADNENFINLTSWFYAGSVTVYDTNDYYLYRSQNHSLSTTLYYLSTK